MKIPKLAGAIPNRPFVANPSVRLAGAKARPWCSLVAAGLLACCGVTPWAQAAAPGNGPPPAGPVTFAVLSDVHFYDTRLGTTGTAFEHYLAGDPKLLHLSAPILESVIADLGATQVRFAIICGDLTKDGERTSHELLAGYLARLELAGIQVFVVPGNHDINNKDAVEYRGSRTIPVPGVSQSQFRTLYQRFGYAQALAHAPDSLSYVAEPVPGVWLLALDSTKAKESIRVPVPFVSGRLSDATMAWAMQKVVEGRVAGKKVIAFMHHGVNPHFVAQPLVFPDYLVDTWWMVGRQLAAVGLKVVFTGHYHSQDASNWTLDAEGNPAGLGLYDIQTSSLLGYPCGYRIASLSTAGVLSVQSRRVENVAGMDPAPAFQIYAETFARSLLRYQVIAQLQYLFGITVEQATFVAPWVIDGLIANYAGNETPSAEVIGLLLALMGDPDPMKRELGRLLYTLWFDPSAGDDLAVTVDLLAP